MTYSKAANSDSLEGPSDNFSPCLKIVKVQSNNKNLFVTIQAGPQILQDPQSSGKDYISLNFGST